jgi:hypothetical protein
MAASAPSVNFPFMIPSMLFVLLKTRMTSVDWAPICHPMLPPVMLTNTGLLHPARFSRMRSTPRPWRPPTTNPTLITPGITAMPWASWRRLGGIPFSGMAVISSSTSTAVRTVFASLVPALRFPAENNRTTAMAVRIVPVNRFMG